MRINPVIFKNKKEMNEYEENLKGWNIELESELEGGRILGTYALDVVTDFEGATFGFLEGWEAEGEGYCKAFDLVTQVHAAALSGYLASGGKLKEL